MHKAPKALITKPPPQDITINPPRDPCTLSNYNNFRTKHTAVDFRIDFDKQSLSGESTLTLESKTEGETGLVVLDTRFVFYFFFVSVFRGLNAYLAAWGCRQAITGN